MTVRKTENRIPADFQPSDLGEAGVTADGRAALISFVSTPLVVGRENVQTGTDCGIGSRVGHEDLVWAKLQAMSEGARIASKKLWS